MRNEVITGNPRTTDKYRKDCVEICGLGEKLDPEKYGHLSPGDVELLRWCVKRGASSM